MMIVSIIISQVLMDKGVVIWHEIQHSVLLSETYEQDA